MDDEDVPVLIVGGGPAGLCTALFLARLGVRSLVAERREPAKGLSNLPRAYGLNARTMELLRVAGVADSVRAAGAELAHLRGILGARNLAAPDAYWILDPSVPTHDPNHASPTAGCQCLQNRYEPVLASAAREHGADVQFGVKVDSFEHDAEGVTAVLRTRATGTRRTVRARYLVAADGASSPVRERLGIARSGCGTLVAAVSIMFRADMTAAVAGRSFFLCFIAGPDGHGVLAPLDRGQLWYFGAAFDPAMESFEDFTDQRCVELIRSAAGQPDLKVRVEDRVPWESGMHVADRFRAGAVFLVGDAAHQMTPYGGFGVNTGIQSGHNLAWKLAAVLHGWAGPALLDSYQDERRPVGWGTAEQAAEGSRLQAGSPASADGMIPLYTVALGARYNSTAVFGAEHASGLSRQLELDGRPGSRAPHVWLERDGQRISTIDLFERAFVLLTGAEGGAWSDAGARVADRLRIPLHRYRVAPDGELVDIEQRWPQAYGLTPAGAVLIRPDGFVAWRFPSSSRDPERTLTDALTHLLCRVSSPAATAVGTERELQP